MVSDKTAVSHFAICLSMWCRLCRTVSHLPLLGPQHNLLEGMSFQNDDAKPTASQMQFQIFHFTCCCFSCFCFWCSFGSLVMLSTEMLEMLMLFPLPFYMQMDQNKYFVLLNFRHHEMERFGFCGFFFFSSFFFCFTSCCFYHGKKNIFYIFF